MKKVMRNNKELIKKFEKDMKKRSRLFRLLLIFDQFFNVLILNGSQDETLSSHTYRRILKGTASKFEIWVCSLLKKVEANHCKKSLGE